MRVAYVLVVLYVAALISATAIKAQGISAVWAGTVPKNWSAQKSTPPGWYHDALCIHQREGAINAATGNGYEGGWQFLASTYASVGGRVLDRAGRVLHYSRWHFDGTPRHWASLDSAKEQLYRVWLVWKRDGGSWREWGTARGCGLR